jgi:hypothetical protein
MWMLCRQIAFIYLWLSLFFCWCLLWVTVLSHLLCCPEGRKCDNCEALYASFVRLFLWILALFSPSLCQSAHIRVFFFFCYVCVMRLQ